ncbi:MULTISPECIES: 30S ribosomal protein S9 [Blattabacterium]|uniref:30S ribosomal protein S9 n=1 Tax=Blattabacterium TaxID=34098 RepID=UPI00023872BE|nr:MULTISPECIES: 30S ribosomal protein S9 [Blattabacterium]AEU09273.1 30S ribosomal protein S9 [Blattabacterium sp. (Cryptocercus punctulatus) str. Cpu]AWU44238.1 30S ribosomal protein S9 [Blattabacterium punctulatus]AWU45322.1 30S ribosomal protein S9 [Blattabacterium punctulatus]
MIHTIGRRKRSLARIYLKPGNKIITINSKKLEKYFPKNIHGKILYPFQLINNNKFDIKIKVCGGGFNGQAEAICLAISRALCKLDPENRKILKFNGLLTRDSRKVERKKFGQKKARKKFQFSKR